MSEKPQFYINQHIIEKEILHLKALDGRPQAQASLLPTLTSDMGAYLMDPHPEFPHEYWFKTRIELNRLKPSHAVDQVFGMVRLIEIEEQQIKPNEPKLLRSCDNHKSLEFLINPAPKMTTFPQRSLWEGLSNNFGSNPDNDHDGYVVLGPTAGRVQRVLAPIFDWFEHGNDWEYGEIMGAARLIKHLANRYRIKMSEDETENSVFKKALEAASLLLTINEFQDIAHLASEETSELMRQGLIVSIWDSIAGISRTDLTVSGRDTLAALSY